jgi:O-acetyl-ADP-ribose deacetylase (regulator of RNase III)
MKYVSGNLLNLAEQGQFDIIVHGCNCFCTMGSGIAGQIASRYPKAYAVDNMTISGDANKLGKFTQAYIDGYSLQQIGSNIRGLKRAPYHFTLINAYTQYGFDPSTKPVDYEAIYSVFKQIKMLYDLNPMAIQRIGIPKIGAGLAGGDWDRIEQIIDSLKFNDITCVVYEDKQ